jgi:hypothetical protein
MISPSEVSAGNGFIDDERVITHGFKWRRNVFENTLSVVCDRRGLAMHETWRAIHFSAVDGAETLMSETDTEHGDLAGEMFDRIRGNAAIFDRFAGARGNDEMIRLERDQFIQRNLIVAEHTNLRAELAEVLNEVISKRVVIINKG